MFETIDYLQFGNERQQLAFTAIKNLGIMESLIEYDPILCGTLPLGIDVKESDLDIIMEVHEFAPFAEKVEALVGKGENFQLKRRLIRNAPVIKANFIFSGFEFELFGQPSPVRKQYAYLHMVIEDLLIKKFPDLKEKVWKLKMEGHKTEPAFCQVLGLEGDPYDALLNYGERQGIIDKEHRTRT